LVAALLAAVLPAGAFLPASFFGAARRVFGLVAAAGAASLPLALATATVSARGPLGLHYQDFFAWLVCSIPMFWGAIALPRWLLASLHPGVFSAHLCEGSKA